ncbi:hypothetical protein [Pseudidiomarina insulisalsae]|uniref:Uncharacterized protein n=1 Tax=Pseudidiomarina insulisalsae TaxID=575789 RepID=A0A432YLL9_9GAMM|nr:hypothetical protein [Pseudidiomarina insulisalsae]RUO61788.1 hypothetical protein CWI71_05355 [Pseudidiomarina insulisalsae]
MALQDLLRLNKTDRVLFEQFATLFGKVRRVKLTLSAKCFLGLAALFKRLKKLKSLCVAAMGTIRKSARCLERGDKLGHLQYAV